MVIDLPQELEEELAAAASRRGLPLSEYVLRLLDTWRALEHEAGAESERASVEQVLAASNRVRLPKPYTGTEPYKRQSPVPITGKPVSEIVIEQRGER